MNRAILIAIFMLLTGAATRGTGQSSLTGPALAAKSRIVVVRDEAATASYEPRQDRIDEMVHQGLLKLTGKASVADVWKSLVQPGDRVGIKVYAGPGRLSGTRAAVVAPVIQGLIDSGVVSSNILVWDRHLADLNRAGYRELVERFGIRLAGSADSGYDEGAFYDAAVLGRLIWGDLEFQREGEKVSRRSHVSRLITRDITKLINIHPLFNHNTLGVYGHLYGLAISGIDNHLRFENSPALLAEAIPEIYAQKEFSDRVVLNITDALLCQYEGEQRSLLHYSAVLNELRFSFDPVALDTLSLQEIDRFRPGRTQSDRKAVRQLLENASLLELGNSDPNQFEILRIP